MRQEIVVETADVASDAGRVAVLRPGRVFLVAGLVERLGDQGALQRDVLRAARAERLIQRPTDRAVVSDTVIA